MHLEDFFVHFEDNYSIQTIAKKLYRINLVDETTQKLSNDKTFNLHILGNKIFFYNPDVSNVEEITIEWSRQLNGNDTLTARLPQSSRC